MPTILRKNGFRFFFYSNERNEPPHVHVVGRGGEPLSLSEVQARGESWRPWRSYAVMYLWCFAGESTSPKH